VNFSQALKVPALRRFFTRHQAARAGLFASKSRKQLRVLFSEEDTNPWSRHLAVSDLDEEIWNLESWI
jgi:hypothetical protein